MNRSKALGQGTDPHADRHAKERLLRAGRVIGRGPRARTTDGTEVGAFFDNLEPRALLTGEFNFSAEEVYLSELVNRARLDPVAEGVRLGLDLSAGLTSGELARLVPQEPLALNSLLTLASRAHSLDMAQRDFFDHVNPDGHDPSWRAQDAGYDGLAGENIAAGYGSIDEVHAAWLDSLGHRKNVLSLHEDFDSSFHYDEFGPGFAFTDIGPFFDYHSELFGIPTGGLTYILGVVYNDLNANSFYGVGEGMNGVRVDVALASSPGTTISSYTTNAAGNYQIAVSPGTYVVTFTREETGDRRSTSVTVVNENVKLDTLSGQLATPIDDYADVGDWANADILIPSETGYAQATGTIEINSDTDLFRYTAVRTNKLTESSQDLSELVGPGIPAFFCISILVIVRARPMVNCSKAAACLSAVSTLRPARAAFLICSGHPLEPATHMGSQVRHRPAAHGRARVPGVVRGLWRGFQHRGKDAAT